MFIIKLAISFRCQLTEYIYIALSDPVLFFLHMVFDNVWMRTTVRNGFIVVSVLFCFIDFLSFSLYLGGKTYMTVSNCPPVGSHISFSGRLCMLALSICFWTPRLSLGHPGSFPSVYELKCMRTPTAPLFNVPCGRCGTTTRVVHPYPHYTRPNRG